LQRIGKLTVFLFEYEEFDVYGYLDNLWKDTISSKDHVRHQTTQRNPIEQFDIAIIVFECEIIVKNIKES